MEKENKIVNIHEIIIQKFIEKKRPPIEMRDQIDLGYTFENLVVELFEIRQRWDDTTKKTIMPFAKSKFIKTKNIWKIYWRRANGNWDPYEPQAEVKNLAEFVKIVEEDKMGCFWG